MSLRAELADSTTGLPVNAGNLETVFALTYGAGVGKIGSFSCSVPAEDVNSQTVAYEQEINIYSQEGHIYRGLIRHKEIQESQDGSHVLVISGFGVEAELAKVTTKTGKTFTQASLSSAVTTLLAMTTGWSAGSLDAPSVTYSKLVKGAYLWPALADVANVLGCYLRADSINKQVDIGAFGTASGIVLQNLPEISPGVDANPVLYPIQAIKIAGDSASVINRIIPLGTATGLNATTTADYTIANATVTSPYAKVTTTDPDGNALYYIEDTASQALYGLSEIVIRYNGLAPTGLTTADFQNASNQLIQQAGADLGRMKALNTSYDVTVVGLKHFANGVPTFQVGDTIRVVYRGVAQDITGARKWLDVDVNLYVWEFTRTFGSDGSDQTRLTLNTVPMDIPSDGNVTRALLDKINGQAMAPSPFVLLNPEMRVDVNGLQIASSTVISPIFFVPAFTDAPGSALPNGIIQGLADDGAAGQGRLVLSTISKAGGASGQTAQLTISTADAAVQSVISLTAVREAGGLAQAYAELNVDPTVGAYFGLDVGTPLWLTRGGSSTSDPTVLRDGMIWYRSDDGKLYARINGVTVPLGGGGMKIQGSGYQVMPAAAVPLTLACAAGAWGNGAYVAFTASTSEADYIVGIQLHVQGTVDDYEVDIATGGAGSETVISTTAFRTQTVAGEVPPMMLPYPLAIATATRIAGRARCNGGGSVSIRAKLIYCKQSDLVSI